ncbi:MAG: DciA family protein [Candidatus Competibacteraceae bacterium]
MADPEGRAAARQHTARLLKMLRGYGSVSEPELAPAAESGSGTVAEAAPAYARLLEAIPNQSIPAADPPSLPSPAATRSPLPRKIASVAPMATVGETLHRQKGVLGQLVAQADQLAQSSQLFLAYLPPHLRDHAILVRMDREGWEVQTDSASWATRLRYALPSIRQALGQHLEIELPKPRIRIVPAAAAPLPRRPPLTLTEHNARLLEATAHNLGDTRLSAALRRLAEHTQPRQAS